MKKKLLAVAIAGLFASGIAIAQTSTTSPTDNTSPTDQSSPAALPSQGHTGAAGTNGQSDAMGSSTSDQSGATDQTTRGKKKKKKNQGQQPVQSGSTNETPADNSSTPSQSAPDSTHSSW